MSQSLTPGHLDEPDGEASLPRYFDRTRVHSQVTNTADDAKDYLEIDEVLRLTLDPRTNTPEPSSLFVASRFRHVREG